MQVVAVAAIERVVATAAEELVGIGIAIDDVVERVARSRRPLRR